jgi:NADH-quinone oxidoreductase E subunit
VKTDAKKLSNLLTPYRNRGDESLLTALHAVQEEFGWLPPEAIERVADTLGVTPSEVYGVATFYSYFYLKPGGRHLIQLCTNVACMIFDGEDLLSILKTKYGLEPGCISPDGRFSLMVMECIGACGTAPAMLVNDDFHENLNAKNISVILERYK